jgi:uridine kinase
MCKKKILIPENKKSNLRIYLEVDKKLRLERRLKRYSQGLKEDNSVSLSNMK